MNKKEFIAAIAEKANLTIAQAEVALSAMFDVLETGMTQQNPIQIAGFGTFTTKNRAERKGRNPSTGKDILIPQAIVPVFRPATQLKLVVNTVNTKEK